MSTKMNDGDWRIRLRCFAPAFRGVDGRPTMTGGSSKRSISSRSRTFDGAPLPERFGPWNSVWKTLRPIEQGWRLRSLLRRACLDEFVRTPDPDVRLDDRARAFTDPIGQSYAALKKPSAGPPRTASRLRANQVCGRPARIFKELDLNDESSKSRGILVIDNDAAMRHMVVDFLEEHDTRAISASGTAGYGSSISRAAD